MGLSFWTDDDLRRANLHRDGATIRANATAQDSTTGRAVTHRVVPDAPRRGRLFDQVERAVLLWFALSPRARVRRLLPHLIFYALLALAIAVGFSGLVVVPAR